MNLNVITNLIVQHDQTKEKFLKFNQHFSNLIKKKEKQVIFTKHSWKVFASILSLSIIYLLLVRTSIQNTILEGNSYSSLIITLTILGSINVFSLVPMILNKYWKLQLEGITKYLNNGKTEYNQIISKHFKNVENEFKKIDIDFLKEEELEPFVEELANFFSKYTENKYKIYFQNTLENKKNLLKFAEISFKHRNLFSFLKYNLDIKNALEKKHHEEQERLNKKYETTILGNDGIIPVDSIKVEELNSYLKKLNKLFENRTTDELENKLIHSVLSSNNEVSLINFITNAVKYENINNILGFNDHLFYKVNKAITSQKRTS